jgi:hypothetical protein
MAPENPVNVLEPEAPETPTAASPGLALSAPSPVGMIGYASGVGYARVGQSRWGVASFVLTGITVLYCLVCVIGMSRAKGWDSLAWLVFGFLGNWIGCGIAGVLGLVGVCQRRRGRRLAAHALWVSLALGLGPLAVFWIYSQS